MKQSNRARAFALWGVLALGLGLGASSPRAWAHGERSQEAFLRMRTMVFYDTKFWSDRWAKEGTGAPLKIGDELVITGKLQILPIWPREITFGGIANLNVAAPGPTFIRTGTWVNGESVFNAFVCEIGALYEYKQVLRARRGADWAYHIHPMFNIEVAGPTVGPGCFVKVDGPGGRPYEAPPNLVKTLTGETIDLETYGVARMLGWTTLMFLIGIVWLAIWCSRPIMPRQALIAEGRAEELITPGDRQLAGAFIIGLAVLCFGAAALTNQQYPIRIPLQSGRFKIPSLPLPPPEVDVKITKATYEVPRRKLTMDMDVTNKGNSPAVLREFTTANVRFLNPAFEKKPANDNSPEFPGVYGGDLVVEPNDPIKPGETKTLHVVMESPVWETERLTMYTETTNRLGGLLFFTNEEGTRTIIAVADQMLLPIWQ
ncbi:bacterial ammonia monooxygenase, subunit AmoB [Candidatus Methylacidithermus pantelleriae]|uniref:Particulate methane monooxygenase subunit B (Alpha subunit) n=1 Tax=Candidatus Methylacidithermus pantelleriae TaxID=2744239 RepID=A0A8J2FTN3_9BACT|nr:bacterial ammonia monooxygenase, subunit AmoB [Candidatus Methylacidithermus pantelleriae]CAF0703657.1 Particulate methane monooxygenase subunit B (alpha subunit) [Candidatus Methylacidithermus pantelleriae]